jgi:rRNA maturation protein Rpf1
MGDDYLNKYEHLFREAGEKYSEAGFGKIIMSEDNNKCVKVDDEKESYQVINIKNMTIKFLIKNDNKVFEEEFKQYIKTTVMPYLEMMIPSTTIFKISFNDNVLDK